MEASPQVTGGGKRKELGLTGRSGRRGLREDFQPKPRPKVTTHFLKNGTKRKRLRECLMRGAEVSSGKCGMDSIFWAGEKLFRLGACVGVGVSGKLYHPGAERAQGGPSASDAHPARRWI